VSKDWLDVSQVFTVTPIYARAFHVTLLVVFDFQHSPHKPKTWRLCLMEAYHWMSIRTAVSIATLLCLHVLT
jgi:hypothetical protein